MESEIERSFGGLVINFELDRAGNILAIKMAGIKSADLKDIMDGIGFLDIVMRHPRMTEDGKKKVQEAKKHLESIATPFRS